jgi:SAM-dependent methyltransferase
MRSRPESRSMRPVALGASPRTWPSVGIRSSASTARRRCSTARIHAPTATFQLGDLHRLPLPDKHVDVVVCGLALTHVRALEPVMAEFVRVPRLGGHVVISDVHSELVIVGSVVHGRGPAGEPALVPAYRHTAGDFVRAALVVGLDVRRCEGPRLPPATAKEPSTPGAPGGDWSEWPWSLMQMVPQAMTAIAGADGIPKTIIVHFQLPGDPPDASPRWGRSGRR